MKQWKADTMSQRERSRNHGPDTKVAFRQSYGMLRQQINWYFQLKDDVLAREFAAFNQEQHSRGFLLYCLMIYTLLLPITFIIMIQDFTRKTPQSDAILSLSIIHTLSAVLTVVSGWRLYFNHCKHADDQIPELDMNSSDTSDVTVDYTQHYCGGWIDYACNPIFNIASQFLLTGIFIRRAFAEKCNEGSYRFLGIFDCNESKEDPGSFLSVAIIIMFISVLNFANIPDTRIEVAWFNLFVTFSIFLVTAVVKHVEGTLLLAIILLLSVAFTIVDIQIRNILIFLTNRKLTELLEENAKMADELHASEMRHMIGNVAHDLKTVRLNHCDFICHKCLFKYSCLFC